jgi:hypothetical protein
MKKILVVTLAIIVLFAAQPAFAGEREDFILREIAEWTNVININGYTILGNWISEISDEDLVYTFELAPGTYYFYGAGGLEVQDIDAYVQDESGSKLDEDSEPDKIPKLKIKLDEAAVVELVVVPFSYAEDYDSGYVSIFATSEGEGEILSFDGEVTDAVEPPPIRNSADITPDELYREEMGYRLDDFLEYEEDGGSGMVQSGILNIEGDSYKYSTDLEPGFYDAYALADSRAENFTLNVEDESDGIISSGQLNWRYAYCLFGILDPQNIGLELVISYGEGQDFSNAYASVLISPVCDVDDESRRAYMQDSMESTLGWMEGMYEVVDNIMDTLNSDGSEKTFQLDLDAGQYYFDCYGGPAISDIDFSILDSDGNILFAEDEGYSVAFGEIEITEPMTITVKVSATAFLVDVAEEYFYYILSKTIEPAG